MSVSLSDVYFSSTTAILGGFKGRLHVLLDIFVTFVNRKAPINFN